MTPEQHAEFLAWLESEIRYSVETVAANPLMEMYFEGREVALRMTKNYLQENIK